MVSSPANAAPAGAAASARRRVSVLLPLPLAGAYDYAVPAGLDVGPGDFVRVPLGPRRLNGVVWDGNAEGGVEDARLKPIEARLDVPPLPDVLRRLVDWVAAYTLSAPGGVLRMCMSAPAALEPPRARTAYALGGPPPPRMTAARQRVLAVLADGPPRPARDLAEVAAVSAGVVRGLADAGTLVAVPLPPDAPFERPDPLRPGPALSAEQGSAAAELMARVRDGFSVTLLEGVTGSGKTEVYFEAIAETLRAGRQALVLLPEIALGAQWLERFEARFGARPAEWHSDLTQGQRRRTWRAVAENRAAVVVAARSGLFLPFPDLGLIVVDEEHDPSFKQEEGVIYNARDMAVVRARLGQHSIVLASATPSLETVFNAQQGRYRRVHLPNRHGTAELPRVEAVDMRTDPPPRNRWLSSALRAALEKTFAAGEQAMLFLNRRGYAPLTLCAACGHRIDCPNCTAWLVEHRYSGRLECHHCGFGTDIPPLCPACGAEDSLKPCGPGVERLAEEVADIFPEVRHAIMASDMLRGPRDMAALVRRITDREIDLVIGTQVMAKGHHFPMLTLVGVVDADLGLAGGDLRAAERTLQLLSQVAGRAGRAEHPGRVILQTYMPEHPAIEALISGDREGFLAREAEARAAAGMPPYGRLAALIVSGTGLAAVEAAAAALGRRAPRGRGVSVLGPAPAPLAMLRGRHRYRLLLKTDRSVNIQAVLRGWLAAVAMPSTVRVQVDVDPYSFL